MADAPTPHIELYLRSLLPDGAHDRQEVVIERLQRLENRGDVEGLSVIVWGKQVSRESAAALTDEGRYVLNRIAEFKQWALSNNVSLESFYQRQAVTSEVTGESYTAITLPVMGLAEYVDGELVHVAPCTNGDVVHTITDRLERLENGEHSALQQEARAGPIVEAE